MASKTFMSTEDHNTLEAMILHGGSFVKALARAAHHADPENLRRIKATWPEYWEKYQGLVKLSPACAHLDASEKKKAGV